MGEVDVVDDVDGDESNEKKAEAPRRIPSAPGIPTSNFKLLTTDRWILATDYWILDSDFWLLSSTVPRCYRFFSSL